MTKNNAVPKDKGSRELRDKLTEKLHTYLREVNSGTDKHDPDYCNDIITLCREHFGKMWWNELRLRGTLMEGMRNDGRRSFIMAEDDIKTVLLGEQ